MSAGLADIIFHSHNMENLNHSEAKKFPTFGFNTATWIFVAAAFILAVIPFVFPVSHSDYMYFMLGNAEQSVKPILLTFPLLGLLAGCFYTKVWRIVVCAILAVVSVSFCFFIEGASHIKLSWGSIFLLAGIAALIKLASSSHEKLEKYPNPLRDLEARKTWMYVGLAIAGILLFDLCKVTAFKGSSTLGATGSFLMDTAEFSKGSDGWYIIVLPIIVTAAAVCAFKKNNKLNCLMCIMMYVPAVGLAIELDNSIKLSTGFYLYILCTTAMLVLTIIDMIPKASEATPENPANLNGN